MHAKPYTTRDAMTHRIMQTELRISVAALVLGGASVSAGFFGMNLTFPGWFDSPQAFPTVVGTTLLCSFAFGTHARTHARTRCVSRAKPHPNACV
jgi:hypothetical protein